MRARVQAIAAVAVAVIVAVSVLLASAAIPGTTGKAMARSAPSPSPSASAVLQVDRNGVAAASYTLAQLEAMTSFAGYAGYAGHGGVFGPDAVTGVALPTILSAALGTPLVAAESVEVAEAPVSPSGYEQTFPGPQLLDPKDNFGLQNATTGNAITPSSLTGTVAAMLVYDDPAGNVMPSSDGPLRFFVADTALADNAVMTGKYSVYSVNLLDVIDNITLTLHAKPVSVRRGAKVVFTGTVKNAVAQDKVVKLRFSKARGYALKGVGKVTAHGAFKIIYKATKVGTFTFVATYKAGKTFVSGAVVVHVKK
jgi:hypothetical protein